MAPEVLSNQTSTSDNNGTATASNTHQFSNKTAIVTGASRGIGAGIAMLLGKSGANVIVNYTSPKSERRAQEVVKAIQTCGSGSYASAIQADITTDIGQKALLDGALRLSTSGKLDILVHNAGDGDDCYLKDITEDFYRKQTDLNMKGKSVISLLNQYRLLLTHSPSQLPSSSPKKPSITCLPVGASSSSPPSPPAWAFPNRPSTPPRKLQTRRWHASGPPS